MTIFSKPEANYRSLDVDMTPSHHDESNDTNIAAVDPYVVAYDTLADGGLVAAAPKFHVSLFTLLDGLDKDVFYAIDSAKWHTSGGPSLVIAVKKKFPEIDASSFVAAFKRYNTSAKFSSHARFFLTKNKIRKTKWFMVRSVADREPRKDPDDQLAAFLSNKPSFWPYDDNDESAEGGAPYTFERDVSVDTVSSLLHSLQVSPTDGSSPAPKEIGSTRKRLMKPCPGFTSESILQNGRINDTQKVANGFCHLVGEGLHKRATDVSNKHPWPYGKDVCGVICAGEGRVMYNVSEKDDRTFQVNSVRCKEATQDGKICEECKSMGSSFYRRCRQAVDNREREFNPRTKVSTLQSPTLAKRKFQSDSQEKKRLRQKIARLESKRLQKKGVSLPDDMKDLFDEETEDLAMAYFEKENVSDDDIEKLLFLESLKNARRAQESGSKRVRHSPLMIRFCITLNVRLGRRNWTSLARLFHLPSQRTLDKYKSVGSNAKDGMQLEVLAGEKIILDKALEEGDLSEDFKEWLRHGILAYDSAKCRDKLIYNFHTGELMGCAHDAFDINIIREEWKAVSLKAEQNGAKRQKTNKKKVGRPQLAKHFLLFYFTSWEAKSRKTQMCVARYGMESITSSWLANTIRKIIVTLEVYGFLVDSVVADGASENRGCNNQLATLSVGELLELTPEQREKLPIKKKIAFVHPTRDDVTVFIWSDMPHWAKKFVNALERTDMPESKTNLMFRGKPLSLKMLETVWENDGGAEGASVRTNRLSREHFHKDSFSRMRVYLAVQVMSMSMCRMIDDQVADKMLDKDQYAPLREIIGKVDRLVDVFNGTKENKQKEDKGCENLNAPNHRHVTESLDILTLFCEWKAEAQALEDSSTFMPYTSFDDLCSMVFGLVGMAQKYLHQDGSRTMVQRRGNTDVLEHAFAHLRARERNFNIAQGRQGVAQAQGVRQNALGGNNRNAPHEGHNVKQLYEALPVQKK